VKSNHAVGTVSGNFVVNYPTTYNIRSHAKNQRVQIVKYNRNKKLCK